MEKGNYCLRPNFGLLKQCPVETIARTPTFTSFLSIEESPHSPLHPPQTQISGVYGPTFPAKISSQSPYFCPTSVNVLVSAFQSIHVSPPPFKCLSPILHSATFPDFPACLSSKPKKCGSKATLSGLFRSQCAASWRVLPMNGDWNEGSMGAEVHRCEMGSSSF